MKFWRLVMVLLLLFIAGGTFALLNYENPLRQEVAGAELYEMVPQAPQALTINGLRFENQGHESYPLLAREGTTYLPLTFHMTSLLNLHLWQEGNDLCLESRVWDHPKPFVRDGYGASNPQELSVKLAEETLYINGIPEKRSGEPLLEFRDIYYLPLIEEVAEWLEWQLGTDAEGNLTLDLDNFIYLADGTTIYQQGDLRIEMSGVGSGSELSSHNLIIRRGGEILPLISPVDYVHFGYENMTKPRFLVTTVDEIYEEVVAADGEGEGAGVTNELWVRPKDYLYTNAFTDQFEFCRVDLETGEVEFID